MSTPRMNSLDIRRIVNDMLLVHSSEELDFFKRKIDEDKIKAVYKAIADLRKQLDQVKFENDWFEEIVSTSLSASENDLDKIKKYQSQVHIVVAYAIGSCIDAAIAGKDAACRKIAELVDTFVAKFIELNTKLTAFTSECKDQLGAHLSNFAGLIIEGKEKLGAKLSDFADKFSRLIDSFVRSVKQTIDRVKLEINHAKLAIIQTKTDIVHGAVKGLEGLLVEAKRKETELRQEAVAVNPDIRSGRRHFETAATEVYEMLGSRPEEPADGTGFSELEATEAGTRLEQIFADNSGSEQGVSGETTPRTPRR